MPIIVWSRLSHVLWYVGDIMVNYFFNKFLDHVAQRQLSRHPILPNRDIEFLPDIYGRELLDTLMDEHDLRRKDLGDIFISDSECAAVLSGQQPLTVDHVLKLSSRFNVSPLVFFPEIREPVKT